MLQIRWDNPSCICGHKCFVYQVVVSGSALYQALNIESHKDLDQSMLSGTLLARAWCIHILIVYLGLFTGAVSSSGSPFLSKMQP